MPRSVPHGLAEVRPRSINVNSHPEAALFSREDHPSHTRILLAGLECFADLGYHGTSTRDISRLAGVSAGALYTHFESKQSILQTISRATHEAMYNEMLEETREPGTPSEHLVRLVRMHSRFHARYRTACRVANYELHSLDPDARQEMNKFRRGMEGIMISTLSAGKESGEFTIPNVDLFGKFILSSGIDVSRWFRPDGDVTIEELGDLYSQMVITAAQCMDKPASKVASSRSRAGAKGKTPQRR